MYICSDLPHHFNLDDLFSERQKFITAFPEILESISSFASIQIKAGWGQGKSTFLEVLSKYLIEQDYCVLHYNAWENDYELDPFVSLLIELLPQMETSLEKLEKRIMAATLGLLVAVGITFIQKKLSTDQKDIFQEYKKYYKKFLSGNNLIAPDESSEHSITNKFHKSLRDYCDIIRPEGKKVVIIVDELDRCRPTYAIELLERIKHLFNVHGMVFIFAVDHMQLSVSVKHAYGNDIDQEGYLRRFFDFELFLPEPDFQEYINQKISQSPLADDKKIAIEYFGKIVISYSKFLDPKAVRLSLRDVEKMLVMLSSAVLIAEMGNDIRLWCFMLSFGVLARYTDLPFFENYFSKDVKSYQNSSEPPPPHFYHFFNSLISVESNEAKIIISNSHGGPFNLLELFIDSFMTRSNKAISTATDSRNELFLSLLDQRIVSFDECGMTVHEDVDDSLNYFLTYIGLNPGDGEQQRRRRYKLNGYGFLSQCSLIRECCYSIISSLYTNS